MTNMSPVQEDHCATHLSQHAPPCGEAGLQPLFVLDAAGNVVKWNEACVFLTGVPARAILGRSEYWRPFFRAPVPMPCDQLLERLRKGAVPGCAAGCHGTVCEVVHTDFQMRDGKSLLFLQAGIFYDKGTYRVWQLVQPLSLKEIMAKSRIMSDILEKIPSPLIFVQNEQIIGANKAATYISGVNSSQDIIGESIVKFIFGEDKEKFKIHIRDNHAYVVSGKTYVWKNFVRGKIRYIKTEPEIFKIGSDIFNLVTLTDITEDREKKRKLLKAKQQLAEQHQRLEVEITRANQIFVGSNQKMQKLIAKAGQLARSDISIVIRGETGTGKSQLAKYIHDLSGRAGKPFVTVNCASIPPQLLESEFFGYVKGAFTGATENRSGFMAAANGGTLFLDEVGECSLSMQAKLLNALEKKKFFPVGSRQAQETDFRLICATNRDLISLREQGRMREDFLYRIMVGEISIPPLRERRGDLSELIDFLMNKLGDSRPMPQKIRKTLYSYKWPGNIRELQNVLLRWLVTGELQFIECSSAPVWSPAQNVPEISDSLNLERYLERAERKCIMEALNAADGRKDRAAVLLGLNIRTMHRKCKKLGL